MAKDDRKVEPAVEPVDPEVPVEPVDPEPQPDPEEAVGDDGVRRDVDLPDEAVPAGDEIESVDGQAAKQAKPNEPGYSLQQAYEGNLDEATAAERGIDLTRVAESQEPAPDDKED